MLNYLAIDPLTVTAKTAPATSRIKLAMNLMKRWLASTNESNAIRRVIANFMQILC